MFNLFSKSKDKSKTSDVFKNVGVDIHSHLLPGIDDGSKNMDESVQLIRAMMQLGFRKLITTPHIMWEEISLLYFYNYPQSLFSFCFPV